MSINRALTVNVAVFEGRTVSEADIGCGKEVRAKMIHKALVLSIE